MRVVSCVFLDGLRRAPVGIALAQDGVYSASLDFVVAGLDFLVGVGLSFLGVIGELVAL